MECVVKAKLRPFTPGEDPYPLYRRLSGPQGRAGLVWKISPPRGFEDYGKDNVSKARYPTVTAGSEMEQVFEATDS
jgi:hypothetical protein